MSFSKEILLASIAAHGLTKTAANRWTDGRRQYSICRTGNGYDIKCVYKVAVTDWSAEVRAAMRPAFLAAQAPNPPRGSKPTE